ncbi:MAG TPA: hypothetical protein VFI53_14005, partial [Myxococcaceae bacterium]|nr:hypothetical protein [Myxococcaceae bacterium]
CANYPPNPPANSGTYGYETGKARCMEHYGRSALPGSPHYLICREEEDFIKGLKPGAISPDKMREQVGRSAIVAATAGRVRYDPKTDSLQPGSIAPEHKDTNKTLADAQAGSVADLGGKKKSSKSKSKPNELSADEKTAVECIVADWEASVKALQSEAIQSNGPGSKAGQQAAVDAFNKGKPKKDQVDSWDKMSKKQKAEAVAARQKELEKRKANTAGESNQDKGPTKDECREYQANWLWQQQQAGGIPPMQPQNPDAPQKIPPPGTGKSKKTTF